MKPTVGLVIIAAVGLLLSGNASAGPPPVVPPGLSPGDQYHLMFTTGDYNFNDVVGAADYTVWANTFGETGVGLPADGNFNGTVDAADYTIWANEFGNTAVSPSLVPEPSSFVLSTLGSDWPAGLRLATT